jgi:hypothetical protein
MSIAASTAKSARAVPGACGRTLLVIGPSWGLIVCGEQSLRNRGSSRARGCSSAKSTPTWTPRDDQGARRSDLHQIDPNG